jgi:hypothetical protein
LSRPVLYSLAGLLALLAAFGAGRYSSPTKTEYRTEYLERVREVRLVRVDRQVETKVRRVIVTKPGGETIVTESVDTKESVKTDSNTDTVKTAEKREDYKINRDAPRLTISVLAAVKFDRSAQGSIVASPTYGLSASYRFAGPVSANVFALANGTFGGGLGLSW